MARVLRPPDRSVAILCVIRDEVEPLQVLDDFKLLAPPDCLIDGDRLTQCDRLILRIIRLEVFSIGRKVLERSRHGGDKFLESQSGLVTGGEVGGEALALRGSQLVFDTLGNCASIVWLE